MGEVYLAEDTRLRRRVALKVLPTSMAQAPERLARFEMEAKLIAALNHPSIVTLYSIEEAEGNRFLTMEFVDGQTLGEAMPAEGFPLAEFFRVAIPLADALGAAHAQGVIHRDLKPSNIMLGRDGRVKVLDFGVGKLRVPDDRTVIDGPWEPSLTREGVILGTPRYMSPEQVQGKPVDHRSDLFSLGIIFYEMLTGRRPFAGDNSAQVISSILRDVPSPLLDLKREAPPPLNEILDRCLAKEPVDRYASAAELVADLKRVEQEMVAPSPTVTRPTRSTHATAPAPPTRRRLLMGAAGLVATVGVAVLVVAWPWSNAGGSRPDKPSIAVLPLGNFTGEAEYFVDGMTDSLIAALARIGGLRVISRQSVMRFKGSKLSLPEIAQELGVEMVVSGSVQRAGQRVRITTELIQPEPEEHLWTETYERDLADILGLQSELAQAIAKEIRVQLTQEEISRLPTDRKVHPQGFEEYLRGRFYWNQRHPEALKKAVGHFNAALSFDPTYAPAYSGLADSYALLGYAHDSPSESYPRAKLAAQRALELDPSLAEAHASMGFVHLYADWDWEAAERELKRAIELDPSYATAHHWYWARLAGAGRFDEAEKQLREALRLDPLSPMINTNLGAHFYLARRYDDASRQIDKTLETHPNFPAPYLYRGWLQQREGKYDEAFQSFAQYLALIGSKDIADRAEVAWRQGGHRAGLETIAEGLAAVDATDTPRPELVAWFYNFLDRREDALAWLEKAYERRSPMLLWSSVAADWDPLRSDPRFERITQGIGLDQPR